MEMADARRYILEAAAALGEQLRLVVFTGGEPFVHPDELEALLGVCRGLDLPTRVVTNGFWARDPGQGLDMLLRMQEAGLTSINFSADQWHLEFMGPEVLRNAVDCAQLLGMHAIVNMAVMDDTDVVGQFCALYGIDRSRVVPLDRPAFRRAAGDAALSDRLRQKIHLSHGHVVQMGRAADAISNFRADPVDRFETGGCCEVVNRPVIYPDGDLQACCCAGGKIATFTVGNARREPLAELFERMLSRSRYQFINAFGPRALHEAIARARPHLPIPERFASICDVCVHAANRLPGAEVDRICEAEALRRMILDGAEPVPLV